MKILTKIIVIVSITNFLYADNIKLKCDNDVVIIENIQQFSIGEVLIANPHGEMPYLRSHYAEIWTYGKDIDMIRKFTSLHKNKKIEVIFGEHTLTSMWLSSEIDNGRLSFSLSKEKQLLEFKNTMNSIERLSQVSKNPLKDDGK